MAGSLRLGVVALCACALSSLPGPAAAAAGAAAVVGGSTTCTLVVGAHDFILQGGTSMIGGHGVPAGMTALRTGSPGQTSVASFPHNVLAPGAKVTGISFSYRYVVGYESTPSGQAPGL